MLYRPNSHALRLTLIGALALTSACKPGDSAGGGTAGKIPVTTSNADAKALFLKGRDTGDQLRNTEAHDLFVQAVAKDSTFALAHLSIAQSAVTNKEFYDHLKAAVAQADKVSDGERYMILSAQASADGDRPKSMMYADSLVTKYPDDERAHMVLGNAYQAREDFDKAAEQFQKAATVDSNYSPAYNSLGYALRPLGKNDEAEKAFKKYIALVPNDPNPYDSYAELLLKMGRFDESIAQYQKALSLDPNFASSRLGISWDMTLQGKFDAALAEADKAMGTARNAIEKRNVIFARAATMLVEGKADMAVAEIQKGTAISAAAGDTSAMASDAGVIGDIYLDAGKADKADESYDKQLDLIKASSLSQAIKDNAEANHHFDHARLDLKKGDVKDAETQGGEFMTAMTAKKNDGGMRAGHMLMGMISLAQKKADDALAHFAQADQQDPFVLYQIGLAQTAKGDKAKAKDMFKSAADLDILPTINYALIQAKAKKLAM